ncbi:MAG: hypothetical protein M0C28_32600 [Candidatus Moduliflexus flocculans]|nr:hypothetical protein [Candidatus Moduliflexus flocculans]
MSRFGNTGSLLSMAQIFLYDTTLRDGTQREDISLSVEDKLTHRPAAGRVRHAITSSAAGRAPTPRMPISSRAPTA